MTAYKSVVFLLWRYRRTSRMPGGRRKGRTSTMPRPFARDGHRICLRPSGIVLVRPSYWYRHRTIADKKSVDRSRDFPMWLDNSACHTFRVSASSYKTNKFAASVPPACSTKRRGEGRRGEKTVPVRWPYQYEDHKFQLCNRPAM